MMMMMKMMRVIVAMKNPDSWADLESRAPKRIWRSPVLLGDFADSLWGATF